MHPFILATISIIFITIPNSNAEETEPYIMKIVAVDYSYVNPNVIQSFKNNFTRFNRSTTSINVSFKLVRDVDQLDVQLKAFKKIGNEYRYTGLSIQRDGCDYIENYSSFFKNGNLTKCPIAKGTYFVNNGIPPTKGFPPHLPQGDFKIETILFTDDQAFATCNVYLSFKANPKHKWF